MTTSSDKGMNLEKFQATFYGLTVRRREVLAHLLAGKTDAAIASELCITPSTVRKHIEEICSAFGLKNLQGERFSLREKLMHLIAEYKPELVGNRVANTINAEFAQMAIASTSQLTRKSLDKAVAKNHLYHNLPSRYHTTFFGQQQYLSRLLELLSFKHPTPIISIEGVGGVGKTALVLEAAYYCLNASQISIDTTASPAFNAIIFTCAKTQHFIGINISRRLQRERTLRDIFKTIFRTLDCLDSIPPDFEAQLECIKNCLNQQQTLLIIDNLETIEDYEDVLSFIGELPPSVKVVLTSRVRIGVGIPIHLDCLPEEEGKNLIQLHAEEKGVNLSLEQLQALYLKTGGLPLAAVYAIGQVSVYGFSPEFISARLADTVGDFSRYCFEDSVRLLRGNLTYQLLMALAIFSHSVVPEAIYAVAFSEIETNPNNGLEQLYKLCLVTQREGRYSMLPLTREYVINELKAVPEFEQKARERWVNWYLKFTEVDAQLDWKQWNEYGNLEQEWENLITVIEYCMAHHLYEPFKKFWHRVKGYTYVCGYWHERLTWSDWLLIAATEQNDLPVQAEALCDKGWTLTLMEQPEHLVDAEVLFEKSWQLKDENNLIFQLELAINRAVLSIHQQQFERARYWLNIEKNLLKQGQIEEGKYCCQLVRILYYEAQVLLKTGNFSEAKLVYQDALKQAGFIQWQQMEVYILNWLAEVAIAQNDPDEAERLLKISLPIAERKNDQRSIALHQRSFARLERLKGNFTQFQKWAAEASEGFERLGMLLDAHIYSNTGDNWLE